MLEQSLTWIGAYDDGRLVGFVNVEWDGCSHGFLVDTTVHPEYQRCGIGTAVVREALEVAREHPGVHWVLVDYDADLRGFYLGGGFSPLENAAIARVSAPTPVS
jgi:ribosomal protein S18 acetylase RimI-like enzyme